MNGWQPHSPVNTCFQLKINFLLSLSRLSMNTSLSVHVSVCLKGNKWCISFKACFELRIEAAPRMKWTGKLLPLSPVVGTHSGSPFKWLPRTWTHLAALPCFACLDSGTAISFFIWGISLLARESIQEGEWEPYLSLDGDLLPALLVCMSALFNLILHH